MASVFPGLCLSPTVLSSLSTCLSSSPSLDVRPGRWGLDWPIFFSARTALENMIFVR